MITFKQFLEEVFDGRDIYPWKVLNGRFGTFVEAKFNKSFLVLVDKIGTGTDMVQYGVSFADESIHSLPYQLKPTGIRSPQEAIKIYNTIGDILKTKVMPIMKSGDVIYFDKVSSRTSKIYERLAKTIAKEINGTYQIHSSRYMIIKK